MVVSLQCIGAEHQTVMGDPDPKHISTSYIERQNPTMRVHMRRFTRLTNEFSRKVKKHIYAVTIHFMRYNFCRMHSTLRATPAMETGLTNHVWTVEGMLTRLARKPLASLCYNSVLHAAV